MDAVIEYMKASIHDPIFITILGGVIICVVGAIIAAVFALIVRRPPGKRQTKRFAWLHKWRTQRRFRNEVHKTNQIILNITQDREDPWFLPDPNHLPHGKEFIADQVHPRPPWLQSNHCITAVRELRAERKIFSVGLPILVQEHGFFASEYEAVPYCAIGRPPTNEDLLAYEIRLRTDATCRAFGAIRSQQYYPPTECVSWERYNEIPLPRITPAPGAPKCNRCWDTTKDLVA